MIIRDYDPSDGQAFQGDVAIIPIPAYIALNVRDEVKPINNRLILQEGEVSGHHHAIDLRQKHFRSNAAVNGDPLMATRDPKLKRALGATAKMVGADRALLEATEHRGEHATARMFRDPAAVAEMVRHGILTRSDLAIGILVVERNAKFVGHEEHDGICLLAGAGETMQPSAEWAEKGGYPFQAGRYYVGRQVENAGAEERSVTD